VHFEVEKNTSVDNKFVCVDILVTCTPCNIFVKRQFNLCIYNNNNVCNCTTQCTCRTMAESWSQTKHLVFWGGFSCHQHPSMPLPDSIF